MERKNLNALLKERGLSQARMSRDIGLAAQSLSDWATQRRDARLRHAAKACEYLQVSLRTFAASIGVDVSKIPLDAEILGVPQFMEVARRQGISLKTLATSFGLDVEGIPDDN